MGFCGEIRPARISPLTTTGTLDLSGSGPCGSSCCRINLAFRLMSVLEFKVWNFHLTVYLKSSR
jgi:hypothetical protein